MSSPADQLNDLLKKSDYLNSLVNTHREATGEAIAVLIKAIAINNPEMQNAVAIAMHEVSAPTGRPSVDGERARLMQIVRENLQEGIDDGSLRRTQRR
jgi:hypothetical protein